MHCWKSLFIPVFLLGLLILAGCGAGKIFRPTQTPSPSATNTTQPTNTSTSTPKPTATSTPIPTPTFPFGKSIESYGTVSNPAIDAMDVKISVTDNIVTAIFYVKDLPPNLNFQKEGAPTDNTAYEWIIFIDIDNNVETGGSVSQDGLPQIIVGTDCFISGGLPGGYSYSVSESTPFEDRTRVTVSCIVGDQIVDGTGTIQGDADANTITLTANTPGISENAQFITASVVIIPMASLKSK